jgi:hypothetical protein
VFAQHCEAEELYPLFSDGTYTADSFASDMDADDQWVVVGAHADNQAGNTAGAAYIYDIDTGALLRKLVPSDLQPGDWFGQRVAIDDQVIAVSSTREDHSPTRSGSVYLFRAQDGELIRKIPAPDSVLYESRFGSGLAIHGNLLAVSAVRGRIGSQSPIVYIYKVDSGELVTSFVPEGAAGFDSIIGAEVEVNQGQVVVRWSAQRFSTNDVVYRIVVHDTVSGEYRYALMPPGSPDVDRITGSIAVDDQRIVLGNFRRSDDFAALSEVHIFDAYSGQHLREIIREDPVPYSSFGHGLALSRAYIAVGATPGDDVSSGAVELYHIDASERVAQVLTADEQVGFDSFGSQVKIVGDRMIVTGYGNDNDGTFSGSGAVFELPCFSESICNADMDGSGELNYFDIALYLQYFHMASPAADLNMDGKINFFDVITFLKDYLNDCV